jgi:hypothetical protein
VHALEDAAHDLTHRVVAWVPDRFSDAIRPLEWRLDRYPTSASLCRAVSSEIG